MITLPIKKKWFDMIVSGEKKEEYRDVTPHYDGLFKKHLHKPVRVCFRNGYRADSPKIEKTVIPMVGFGIMKWGAQFGVEYYVLVIQEEHQ